MVAYWFDVLVASSRFCYVLIVAMIAPTTRSQQTYLLLFVTSISLAALISRWPSPSRFTIFPKDPVLHKEGLDRGPDMPLIQVLPYDPAWPTHFTNIASQLSHFLNAASVAFTTIEHVGSTSIPSLAAKPNIDIVILVKDKAAADAAREALIWQPSPTEYYKCIGDGGIRGRISMKYQDWEALPQRSVYIIAEDNEEGMLSLRGYRDVRECLRKEENGDLRKQYEECKMAMVKERVEDGVEYGQRKNGVIRKVLVRTGWTDEEVSKKEGLDTRQRSEGRDYPY